MNYNAKYDKLSLGENGEIKCPYCRHNLRGVRAHSGAVVKNISVKCTYCKRVVDINIPGQSSRSQSR